MTDNTTGERLLDSALGNIKKMSEYIQTGRQEVTDTAIELLENNVSSNGIDSLQNCIMNLIKAEHRVKAFTKSVDDLKSQWQNGDLDEGTDVIKVLENSFKNERQRTSEDVNVWDHEFMVAFVDQLKAIDSTVPIKTGANNGKDSEMEMAVAHVSTKCPFTQVDMVDPVKDKTCGHSFEKSAVLNHIAAEQKKGKQAKCPYPGCTNVIKANNLEENVAIKRLLRRRDRAAILNPSGGARPAGA